MAMNHTIGAVRFIVANYAFGILVLGELAEFAEHAELAGRKRVGCTVCEASHLFRKKMHRLYGRARFWAVSGRNAICCTIALGKASILHCYEWVDFAMHLENAWSKLWLEIGRSLIACGGLARSCNGFVFFRKMAKTPRGRTADAFSSKGRVESL